jgi:serine/threonine protein kinase
MEPLTQSDPRRIANYTILARLGAGASGIVYAARDAQGMDVALKVLRPELADNMSVRTRLSREAQILKQVTGPRTVAFLDIDADCLTPFLAMELVHGKSLEDYIKDNGPIQGAMLTSLFESLVEALSEIHSVGVTHRDLKPSNIIFGRDGIKVADFGISSVVDSAALTSAGVVLGTASWISPEQINGLDVSASSDIFNLGLLMAFAATGKHPFGEGRSEALMYRILHEEPTVNGLPEGLKKITLQCLQKDRNERPTADKLRDFINGKRPDNLVASPSTRHEETSERTRILGVEEISSITSPIADTRQANFESSSGKSKGFKKEAILAGLLATALLVLAIFFVVGRESSPKSSFEDEFEKIFVFMEKTHLSAGEWRPQKEALEREFFNSIYSTNANEFWAAVRQYGPQFRNDYNILASETYDNTQSSINELRSAPIGQVENRDGLLKIRSKTIEHFSIWLDQVYSYLKLIDAYVDTSNRKSWNDHYETIVVPTVKPVSKTWDEMCLLLGDLQPLNGSIDYSKRIAAECN